MGITILGVPINGYNWGSPDGHRPGLAQLLPHGDNNQGMGRAPNLFSFVDMFIIERNTLRVNPLDLTHTMSLPVAGN